MMSVDTSRPHRLEEGVGLDLMGLHGDRAPMLLRLQRIRAPGGKGLRAAQRFALPSCRHWSPRSPGSRRERALQEQETSPSRRSGERSSNSACPFPQMACGKLLPRSHRERNRYKKGTGRTAPFRVKSRPSTWGTDADVAADRGGCCRAGSLRLRGAARELSRSARRSGFGLQGPSPSRVACPRRRSSSSSKASPRTSRT